jgi:hypothetical protein
LCSLVTDFTNFSSTLEDPSTYKKEVEEAAVIIDTVLVLSGGDPSEASRKALQTVAELSKQYSQVS